MNHQKLSLLSYAYSTLFSYCGALYENKIEIETFLNILLKQKFVYYNIRAVARVHQLRFIELIDLITKPFWESEEANSHLNRKTTEK